MNFWTISEVISGTIPTKLPRVIPRRIPEAEPKPELLEKHLQCLNCAWKKKHERSMKELCK